MTSFGRHDDGKRPDGEGSRGVSRSEDWPQRCARLFEELRKPARAMVARAYGRALSDEEIDDAYSAAWAATLAALRDRGRGMNDGELRAYVLTAVASHASKEMRRRSRKPSHPLEVEREQSTADDHAALPEELAIGSEARGVARDLLTSLPERRRAVMLLRYGWGLSPKEVCALVPGLSARAYRKEITRGVEDLIEGLRRVESGEWCADRERHVRDLVAGTASESERRQATEHLRHCRACAELAARLRQELHAIGGLIALSTVAGSIGGTGLGLLQRLGDALAGIRSAASAAVDRAESTFGTFAATGGAKGSGAAGVSAMAKLAGAGSAAKAAVACAGAGVAATVCVATGVVPVFGLPGLDPVQAERSKISRPAEQRAHPSKPRVAIASVRDVSHAVRADVGQEPAGPGTRAADPPPAGDPAPAPVDEPVVPAPVEEFDPVAPTPSSSTSGAPSYAPQSAAPAPAAAVAGDEFGP